MTTGRRIAPDVERELVCPDCGKPPNVGTYPPVCGACGWHWPGGSLTELAAGARVRRRQFALAYWVAAERRYRACVGNVGEDGILPDTWYRAVDGKLVVAS